jgi:outer membrane biosynthesis protein TonB
MHKVVSLSFIAAALFLLTSAAPAAADTAGKPSVNACSWVRKPDGTWVWKCDEVSTAQPTVAATAAPTRAATVPPAATATARATAVTAPSSTPRPPATSTPRPPATSTPSGPTRTPGPTNTPRPTNTAGPSPTPRPTRTPAPTATRAPATSTPPPAPTSTPAPPATATPDIAPTAGPTVDYWATLIALPTATPAANGGAVKTMECDIIDGKFTCGDVPLRGETPISCPINEVLRVPYPRSLVNETTKFNLVPATWFPSESGTWSTPSDPDNINDFLDSDGNPIREGLYRRISLGLRAERLKGDSEWPPRPFIRPTDKFQTPEIVPPVTWTFAGRAANGEGSTQTGLTSTYSYAAASYYENGLDTGAVSTGGRRFDFAARKPSNTYDLPAYPVKIISYCGFWYAIRGEVSKKEWKSESSCENKPIGPDGKPFIPAGMAEDKCFNGQISYGSYIYRWESFQTPWRPKDLREEFWPTSYIFEDRATSGGVFGGREWFEAYAGGILVPAIEVQTVQQ